MKKVLAVAAACFVVTLITLRAQAPSPETPNASDVMYAAIRADDLAKLTALIKSGTDVNVRDRRGAATPLMHAAAIGSIDVMRLLIDSGADVNAKSATNATALMWAGPNAAKVKLLLDRGADVHIVAENGRNALWIAAASDESAEVVRLLLAKGADPKLADKTKATPLWAAALGNDTKTIRLLLNAGVEVDTADTVQGLTALMQAVTYGNVEAIRMLLAKGANPNAVSGPPGAPVKNGIINLGHFTPLTLAATESAAAVKTLLDGGAMPTLNTPEVRGMTPLMVAASYDHADPATIRLLLARGADVSVRSAEGETALDWAQKAGATRTVSMLKLKAAPAGESKAVGVPPPVPVAHRAAIERSIALIERASGTFFGNSACGSCHSQNITDVATSAARRKGISIDDGMAARRAAGANAVFSSTASQLLLREDTAVVDIPLYTLAGFAAGSVPASRATDVLVHNIVAQQLEDGHWHVGGIPRPPIEDGDFSRTALGVRALTAYAMPGRGAELRERANRATEWLRHAVPMTNEDRSYRLLGLKWGGADVGTVAKAARELTATQRADGGFAQRAEMASDAYATGQAMYALLDSGAANPATTAIQRGTAYLLSTQRADGSWYVRSRAPKFQPYFDGGFPYEHDQWISAMATGWSTAALSLSLADAELRTARAVGVPTP